VLLVVFQLVTVLREVPLLVWVALVVLYEVVYVVVVLELVFQAVIVPLVVFLLVWVALVVFQLVL